MGRRELVAYGQSLRATEAPGLEGRPPPDFPGHIAIAPTTYINWAQDIDCPCLWTAVPNSPEEVVEIANWAAQQGYRVRAKGRSHNWSPLIVPEGTQPSEKVVLVDTAHLNGDPSFDESTGQPLATFGAGTTMDVATAFLQRLDNGGASRAPGYSFENMPAPGDITIAGALAICAHGTSVPWNGEPKLGMAGGLSNLLLSFTAVVTDPDGADPRRYVLKTFHRSDADAGAFLVHLGRAFLTEVTLRVVPNYYLQTHSIYPKAGELFEAPSPEPTKHSFSGLLQAYGRVAAILFQHQDIAWVKVWNKKDHMIRPQRKGPYPYQWANFSLHHSKMIRKALFAHPSWAVGFGEVERLDAQLHEPQHKKMNGTARDLLLYVQPNTLRMTAFGYALQCRRQDVQYVADIFYAHYAELLEGYRKAGKYPLTGPMEVRVTTVDQSDELGLADPAPAALSEGRAYDPELDTVFWFDMLTMPGTAHANEFFTEFEEFLYTTWGDNERVVVRPEWCKAWAYTPDGGPYTNTKVLARVRDSYNGSRGGPGGKGGFDFAKHTLEKYDSAGLYKDVLLDQLFG